MRFDACWFAVPLILCVYCVFVFVHAFVCVCLWETKSLSSNLLPWRHCLKHKLQEASLNVFFLHSLLCFTLLKTSPYLCLDISGSAPKPTLNLQDIIGGRRWQTYILAPQLNAHGLFLSFSIYLTNTFT